MAESKGFWDDYNKQQKKIMEQQIEKSKGRPAKPIQVSKRVPGTPVKKAPAKKKK